jgi:hypothetical protein
MPVGFSSPVRNLFLLGSTGAQVVTNFFKTIDQSAGTDGVYLPDEIKYNFADQKFVLAGSASDTNSKGFGWFEKRDQVGSAEWDIRVEATSAGVNTTLRAMELDSNDNLIVVGKTAGVPWIAKYSNGGVIDWQSTTNSGDVEYTGITSDSNGNYYACGNTPTSGEAQAFVEKFDANGNPGWGKSAFMLGRDVALDKIAANDRGEVVAVGLLQDDEAYKGYIVKIDTNTGEVLWDRTLRSYKDDVSFGYTPVFCENVFIDSKDQIYIVGRYFGISESRGFIVKYTAEGNMIWQKETPVGENIEYYEVKSDGETEQTIVFGRYFDSVQNDWGGILSKYSKDGSLVWRRTLFSSYNNSDTFGQAGGNGICLDADPSFYYLMYIDDAVSGLNGTPESYTFGKVSSSGNGLGDFQYTEGTGETIDYKILNIQDKIGRLSDGSVRQDTSDLITYPFNANKLLFDDLATQVTNKKRQMDSADSFEYSGSPAIRPADFQELNLLGDVYSGSGDWLDQSGKGNDGVVNGATHNAAGYWEFSGTDNEIISGPKCNTLFEDGGSGTIEMWVRLNDVSTRQTLCSGYIATVPDRWDFEVSGGVLRGGSHVNGFFAGTTTLSTATWYHFVFTLDKSAGPGTLKTYVNTVGDTTQVFTLDRDWATDVEFGIGNRYLQQTDFPLNGDVGEVRLYPRALTPAQVFQNYNATKSKYINEAPDTAPKIGPGIVYDSNLLLNYDFGNRATYNRAENLVAKSEDFSGSEWASGGTQGKCDVIDTDIISPFGTKNVQLLDDTATGVDGMATDERIDITASNTQDYCFSIYAKKGTAAKFDLYLFYTQTSVVGYRLTYVWDTDFLTGGGGEGANGVAPNYGYEDVGNGWYRFWLSAADQNLNTQVQARIYPASRDTGPTGSTYFWGAQVEKGSTPGRYIKTSGTAITAPTTVKNLSSSSYTGTFDAETAGQSPEFNSNGYMVFGSNETIRFGSLVDLGFPSGSQSHTLTVEFWVQSNTEASHIFAGIQGPDTERFYLARRGGSWDFGWGNFGWDNGFTGGTSASDRATVSTNTWTHYCISAQSGVATLYINGSRTVEKTDTTVNFGSGDWPIGSWFNPANTYNVSYGSPNSIAECRIYNRALSATEISQNFNATRSKYGV